jgi:outer membrane receptor protein involved in Fe transport
LSSRPNGSLARVLALVAVAAAALPQAALGQGVADEADLLFRRGAALVRAGKLDEALLAFHHSNRLARNRNALYNIALCYLRTGQHREAFRYLTEYEREPLTDAERAAARRHLTELRPHVALLAVTSTPPGAVVYIDRKDLGARGSTPGTFAVTPGPHTVLLELPGFTAATRPAAAVLGRTQAVEVPLAVLLGAVEVQGQPATAVVRVDRDHGPPHGVVPARLALPLGRHTIYVSQDGYRTARSDVEVLRGRPQRVDVALERLPAAPGKVLVEAERRGAIIELDGQAVGVTPALLDVPAGRHRLRVLAEDYAPFAREIVVVAGGQQRIDARLSFASEAEVGAASKAVQRIEDAPASVTVVGRDEIAAFGYRTLGELLRGVRGFFLSDDRMYQNAGVRGFGPPGDNNNRILVLADGHVTNEVWSGAGFVGHDFAADLGDVERVEVVRGPGSVLYGTGAFFGVIGVTSRTEQETRFELGTGAGGLGEVYGRLSGAQALGQSGGVRLSASTLYSPRGMSLTDPASGAAVADNDGERAVTVGANARLGDFSFIAKYNDRKKYLPTEAFGITPGTGRAFVADARGFLEARWEKAVVPALRLTVRGYYDHMAYAGQWPYSPTAAEDLHDAGSADWLGVEARARLALGERLAVMAGVEGAYAPAVHMRADQAGTVSLDEDHAFQMASLFALIEGRPLHELTLSAGVRGDYHSNSGWAVSPRVAALVRPYARGITKLIFGRAFRAPSVYELNYHDGGVTQVPSQGLGPETIWTGELEHTHAFGRRVFGTASVYYNDVRGLVGLGPAGADPRVPCTNAAGCVQFGNRGHIGTLGVEAELRRTWGHDGTIAVAYAYQRSRDLDLGPFLGAGATRVVNSPEHLAYLRFGRPLLGRLLVLGAELTYAGERRDRDGGTTGRMLLGNLTLSGRFRDSGVRYALSVYNLFDWRYGVPVGSEYGAAQLTVPQSGRTFLATLGAAF